jgi:hypothetical protein
MNAAQSSAITETRATASPSIICHHRNQSWDTASIISHFHSFIHSFPFPPPTKATTYNNKPGATGFYILPGIDIFPPPLTSYLQNNPNRDDYMMGAPTTASQG